MDAQRSITAATVPISKHTLANRTASTARQRSNGDGRRWIKGDAGTEEEENEDEFNTDGGKKKRRKKKKKEKEEEKKEEGKRGGEGGG